MGLKQTPEQNCAAVRLSWLSRLSREQCSLIEPQLEPMRSGQLVEPMTSAREALTSAEADDVSTSVG